MAAHENAGPRRIGRGRSAVVYRDRDAEGREIARKIFVGEGLSKVVLYLLTGAPNPYTWCEPAIRTAVLRRRILAPLVHHWLGDVLRLPRTGGWRFDHEHRAFELDCELIDGRHAPLRGPDPAGEDPLRHLMREVMRPLQRRLRAAGFDGLLWQAGLGNPVAASNFMLDHGEGRPRWVWIDLESGVPALFALDPRATLGFYLPRSLHHRRWLFDDVDVDRLRRYLASERDELARVLGPGAMSGLEGEVDELERTQTEWKALPRHRRSIGYELARGRISEERAEHYAERPLRWYARMIGRGLPRAAAALLARARRALGWLLRFDYRRLLWGAGRFAVSQRYRAAVARRLVASRIRAWSLRRFLAPGTAERLHGQLEGEDTSSWVTDFGVHLAIKPIIKPVQWFLLPALLAAGAIGPLATAVLLVTGGMIGRTLYTGGRLIQATLQGKNRPWVALMVGLLPVVGNAAYPAQLLYRGTEKEGLLARFLLYDSLAAIGRGIPIWGGADSLLEHAMNRLGDGAIRLLARPVVPAQPRPAS